MQRNAGDLTKFVTVLGEDRKWPARGWVVCELGGDDVCSRDRKFVLRHGRVLLASVFHCPLDLARQSLPVLADTISDLGPGNQALVPKPRGCIGNAAAAREIRTLGEGSPLAQKTAHAD